MRRKYPVLSSELGRDDTQSIWYSREHIAKLLEEIDLANGDGLRVYFGTYEEGHEFEGQLCLLMNSTREKNVGGLISHVNVRLEDEPNFSDRSSLTRAFDLKGASTKKDFNFGSPCPPRCSGELGDDDE